MQVLNRARHLYSDEYIVSDSIKFEFNQMYLFHKNRWTECEESTRSINFEHMIDKNGKKIFASLSEDGVGGDIRQTMIYGDAPICMTEEGYCILYDNDKKMPSMINLLKESELIGIHKG